MNRATTSTFKINFSKKNNFLNTMFWACQRFLSVFLEDLTYCAQHLIFEVSVVGNCEKFNWPRSLPYHS